MKRSKSVVLSAAFLLSACKADAEPRELVQYSEPFVDPSAPIMISGATAAAVLSTAAKPSVQAASGTVARQVLGTTAARMATSVVG